MEACDLEGKALWICGKTWKPWFRWLCANCWKRKWQPTPVLLPGKSHEQRSLVGYSLWDRKESDTTERLKLLQLTELEFPNLSIGENSLPPLISAAERINEPSQVKHLPIRYWILCIFPFSSVRHLAHLTRSLWGSGVKWYINMK